MKPVHWILVALALLAVLSVPFAGRLKKSPIEVRRLTPRDSEILEEWERVTTEPDVLGVTAAHVRQGPWAWQVSVNAAEGIREGELAARLAKEISTALQRVKGVTTVVRQDREVWALQGDPKCDDLVRAGATAIDRLAPEIRKAPGTR